MTIRIAGTFPKDTQLHGICQASCQPHARTTRPTEPYTCTGVRRETEYSARDARDGASAVL